MNKFKLTSEFEPKGDQPKAIEKLSENIMAGKKHQTLLGVTGSGKTFTMAQVINNVNKPTLVIAHNKTLAAQLYNEFKELFPENRVEYFVSYYDYYQPEAYLPVTDTYIEKDSSINDAIDKMRHSATRSVVERRDVIVVASVSCIYGIGSPESYKSMNLFLEKGKEYDRDDILKRLIEIQYQRNDMDFSRGTFRVRGNVIDIFPAYEEDRIIRAELLGDTLEKLTIIDPLTVETKEKLERTLIFPNSHFVTPKEILKKSISEIKLELADRIKYYKTMQKYLEAQRIEQRTKFDLEMIAEIGYCKGIENYSRYLAGRAQGEPPYTLIDYFPDDFLFFIDESHATVPQIGGMHKGDRSRKMNLVEHGFRLPSALDNRPLNFTEFENIVNQVVYVSATPSEYEIKKSQKKVIEQVIRPTGLIDPKITVKPAKNQVDNLLGEIKKRTDKQERVLVTTLTKRMAENLSKYFSELGINCRYLHSEIETIERTELIRGLRAKEFDVLIGINLLREGLDIPEVSLVAILDADKEGFLRSARSLIQTTGRAARNINGEVIMYADKITNSMDIAIKETNRRRKIQEEYNKKNNITPKSIQKKITNLLESIYEKDYVDIPDIGKGKIQVQYTPDNFEKVIAKLQKQMKKAAKDLNFEKAAAIRDEIRKIKEEMLWN